MEGQGARHQASTVVVGALGGDVSTAHEDTTRGPGWDAPSDLMWDEPWDRPTPHPDDVEADEFWASLEAELAEVEPAGHPDEELRASLRATRHDLDRAVGVVAQEERSLLFEATVSSGLDDVAALTSRLEVTTYALTAEAVERGLPFARGLTTVDWLRVRMPRMPVAEAAEYAAIASISRNAWGAVLGEAMLAGRVARHRAAKVARTLRRLITSLHADELEVYAQIATEAACNTEVSDRELAIVCARLIELLLQERKPGERERTAWELRNAFQKKNVGPGLTRIIIDAPDAAAATLSGIFSSALAAPTPDSDGNPDTRTPGQRRFDAIMSVVNRGLGNPGAAPSSARAAVILTLPADPTTGTPAGPMTSPTGDYVPPRQAALMACSADITPIWLSAQGEPLAVGRTQRFATPAQWKALVVRDRHCTFPGCTVPPQWCDSHHIIWWSRDGDTDILNLALLCGAHHTYVHLHDLVAEIIGGVVVWHV